MVRHLKDGPFRIVTCLGVIAVVATTLLAWDAPKRWIAERASKRYVEALRSQDDPSRDDLVPAVRALQEHLSTRHIKLTVVLAPSVKKHLEKDGPLRRKALPGNGVIFTAERDLRAAGLRVLNLLPDVHLAASLAPEPLLMAQDGFHYNDAGGDLLAAAFLGRLKSSQKEKAGKESLLIGDCFAQLFGQRLRAGQTMPKARDLWKNAASNEMGREVSGLPPSQLKGVHQVYWIIQDAYLPPKKMTEHPFPPLRQPPDGNQLADAPRVVKATVTRGPVVSLDFHKTAPYANALVATEFRTESGEDILGLIYVMRDHQLIVGALFYGYAGQPMTLTLLPWDAAVAANPALRTEQVLESAPDFILPRYFIQGWFHGH